jgi:hypothetical protein
MTMFSSGQKVFALVFLISFGVMLVLAYRSDAKTYKAYYKNVWAVLLAMLLILALLTLLIKVLH